MNKKAIDITKKKIVKLRKRIINMVNRKGFTLIELLATIAVLSLVTTIVVFTAVGIIDGTKQKTYDVTINNIEKYTSSYVLEEGNSINWLNGVTDDYQYQCVTVQRLIDTGYFTGDILDSYVSKNKTVDVSDYVYVERDTKSKTLTRNILLVNDRVDSYAGLCSDIVAGAFIGFSVEPDGWSLDKEIAINYNIYNNLDNVTNYKYNYKFDEMELEKQFNKQKMVEDVTVLDNGTLVANIKDKNDNTIITNTLLVNKIDRIGPIIGLKEREDKTVRGNATISLVVEDDRSGVDGSSFVTNDLKVYIGNNLLDSGYELRKIDDNNYEVSIENYSSAGGVRIIIDDNKVLDSLGNGNIETEISTGIIFNNTYTIKYNANGGPGSMTNTVCTYGSNCTISNNTYSKTGYTFAGWTTNADGTGTKWSNWDGSSWIGWSGKWEYVNGQHGISNGVLQLYAQWPANTYTIKYNANEGSGTTSSSTHTYDISKNLTANGFSRTGYTFAGWNTKADGTGTSYSDKQSVKNLTSTKDGTVTLYAQWAANKVIIKHKLDSGETITSSTTGGSWSTGTDGIIKVNGSEYIHYIDYGSTIGGSGLANYNNSEYINITNSGRIATSGSEWICDIGACQGKVYSQDKIDYSASDFCDASNGNCTVVLKVNWVPYKEVTTNNTWFIWSAPRLMWRENSSKVINGIVAWDAAGESTPYDLSNNSNDTSYIYQYNYAMGTWMASKKVLVCVGSDGNICSSDLDKVQNSPNGLAFLKVWIQESDITKSGTYGCLYNGSKTLPMSSCAGTTSMVYNGKTYWSVWVSRYAKKDGGYSIQEWIDLGL